jgi:hypothetical protein
MAFVSGFSVSATAIGEPDMGLLTQTEFIIRSIKCGTHIPHFAQSPNERLHRLIN